MTGRAAFARPSAMEPVSNSPPQSFAAKRRRLETALGPLEGQARLAWLVEQARQRPGLPVALKTEANRVEGCLAQLWLACEVRDGRCWFQSDSDSQIVRAIASLLCDFYSGEPPGDITHVQMDQLADLADRLSSGQLRTTHDQNLVLGEVRQQDLIELKRKENTEMDKK